MAIKILVVEDEIAIREMLTLILTQQGFDVAEASDYRSAVRKIGEEIPHLVLLDWMLPGKSGLHFLQYLRQHELCKHLPAIMLTAKTEEKDCITCLDNGADDYITKPFSPKSLLARINAVLRRTNFDKIEQALEIDGLVLDTNSHQVTANKQAISLSSTEFKLLYFFMKHPDKVYSREQLLERVWGNDIYVEDRTVDVYVRRLRKSLSESGYDNYIQTIRGSGYRFSKPQL